MELFLQTVAGIFVAVILWIMLSGHGKDYAVLLTLGACCMAIMVILRILDPVLDLLNRLQSVGNLNPEWISVMLKAVGIGLIVEIGSLICADAGNGALSKVMQLLGTASILWLCVPLINSLMTLLEQILGGV